MSGLLTLKEMLNLADKVEEWKYNPGLNYNGKVATNEKECMMYFIVYGYNLNEKIGKLEVRIIYDNKNTGSFSASKTKKHFWSDLIEEPGMKELEGLLERIKKSVQAAEERKKIVAANKLRTDAGI